MLQEGEVQFDIFDQHGLYGDNMKVNINDW